MKALWSVIFCMKSDQFSSWLYPSVGRGVELGWGQPNTNLRVEAVVGTYHAQYEGIMKVSTCFTEAWQARGAAQLIAFLVIDSSCKYIT